MNRTRSMSTRAEASRARAYASTSSLATHTSTGWKRVIATTRAMYVSSTSPSRSAQSVSACGQAIRIADWRSHSAGKRGAVPVMRASWSEDGRLGADFGRGRLVGDDVDHAVLLEVHGELRVGPTVDGRPLALLPAARIHAFGRGAEAGLDLGHALATQRQARRGFVLHALDEQGLGGSGAGNRQQGDQRKCGDAGLHWSPLS